MCFGETKIYKSSHNHNQIKYLGYYALRWLLAKNALPEVLVLVAELAPPVVLRVHTRDSSSSVSRGTITCSLSNESDLYTCSSPLSNRTTSSCRAFVRSFSILWRITPSPRFSWATRTPSWKDAWSSPLVWAGCGCQSPCLTHHRSDSRQPRTNSFLRVPLNSCGSHLVAGEADVGGGLRARGDTERCPWLEMVRSTARAQTSWY